MRRYNRNMTALTKEENDKLHTYRVCIVGCGALGEYVLEMLGRIGIGHLTIVDPDGFDETNLNRQIYSDTWVLGRSKVEVAQERMAVINPLVKVKAISLYLDKQNALGICRGHDLIIDALDNLESRFVLQDIAQALNIPLVHGAIAGWYGQVCSILPGDRSLDLIYGNNRGHGIEKEQGNPSFTPALVASIQVAEAIKILIGRGEILQKQLLYIDLLNQEYMVLPLVRK
ncbi:MAG TPA: molybdopterin biosynthesis protein MoeB [Syntrophomonas sp.]|jgi:molybdopterin/thiamine biosynthesis adenylyltransferase|nr:molybdopterin biosynthesis protein MoeB [Syntrophomonas sp.]